MRIRLKSALAGQSYSFPGVCTHENGWTLPDNAFMMQELLGKKLIPLAADEDGVLKMTKAADGGYELTAPVSGFLTPKGDVRKYGHFSAIVNEHGDALVMFGTDVLHEESFDVPNGSLSTVVTPDTPRSLAD